MLLKFDFFDIRNSHGNFLVSMIPVIDDFSLYLFSSAIVVVGLISLIYFMSAKKIGGAVLDIGGKAGSLAGGIVAVLSFEQGRKESNNQKGGNDNKGGDKKGGNDNKGEDKKGSDDNKGSGSGSKK